MRISSTALAVLLSLSAAAAPVHAQVRGAIVANNGQILQTGAWNLGRSFTVVSAANVVSLGIFDQGSDGLRNSHQVGLWNSTGTLLFSTLIASGTSAILDGNFRFNDIAPISLNVGSTYFVAATYADANDDPYMVNATFASAPMITHMNEQWEWGSALVFPDLINPNVDSYWGGDVRLVAVTATPEPATVTLLALGLAGIAVVRRRQSR